jgi:hypothetical protein
MGALSELENLEANAAIEAFEQKQRITLELNALKKGKGTPHFPTEVFPPKVRGFILANTTCYGATPDHYGLAILTVAGAILGNRVWARERTTDHPPLLYSILVDLPGRGKTPIVKAVAGPVFKIEKAYRKEHAEALRRAAEGSESSPSNIPPGKEIVMQDFTLEAIHRVLQVNPLGMFVLRDEVISWIKSMNAYRSGSDQEYWLENYNGGTVKVSRVKDSRPMYIPHSFVAVLGGTQPAMLEEFGADKKSQNGFLARLLFSYPENTIKPKYSTAKPDPITYENWSTIINRLYKLPIDAIAPADHFDDWEITPTRIELDATAQALYRKYYDGISEETNHAEDEISAAVITKYDSHVLRLALILRMLIWAEEEATDWEIGLEELAHIQINQRAMQGAIHLAAYFKHTSLRVVNRIASPIEQLEDKYRITYINMPEEVTRERAVELAKTAGISDRSLARFLNREDLFRRIGQGRYLKRYA